MNTNARKNIIYSLVLFALVVAVYAYRNREGRPSGEDLPQSESGTVTFSGQTMGTTYQITYLDEENRNFQTSIDSLLNNFNQSVSTYEPTSEVNRFNLRDTLISPSPTLLSMLAEANRMYDLNNGAVDPTQSPLDKIWSFSPSGAKLQDSTDVNKVLTSVGLKKLIVTDTLIRKTNSGISLDFSRSGKGYAVDLIGAFLKEKGINHFLVQLGGENLAVGKNAREELWKIGVYYLADSMGQKAEGILALSDKAISTAGNFDQFYTKDSTRVSFTLDPRTGFPVTHGLLGVTVIGTDSKTADAMADALLVMGWREAIRLDSIRNDLEMLLIYNEKGGKLRQYISPELVNYLSFEVK
jgi:thiamine biosynthesis lipoprotein